VITPGTSCSTRHREAREHIAWAFEDYNEIKPQERLDWMTPKEYHEEMMPSAK